jgi:hypothetical protein
MNPYEQPEQPIGCQCNVTFGGQEMAVIIAFGDDPVITDDIGNPWYDLDINVFYYLNDAETDQLHDAVNKGLEGFAVDGEIEIVIDSDFEYLFL